MRSFSILSKSTKRPEPDVRNGSLIYSYTGVPEPVNVPCAPAPEAPPPGAGAPMDAARRAPDTDSDPGDPSGDGAPPHRLTKANRLRQVRRGRFHWGLTPPKDRQDRTILVPTHCVRRHDPDRLPINYVILQFSSASVQKPRGVLRSFRCHQRGGSASGDKIYSDGSQQPPPTEKQECALCINPPLRQCTPQGTAPSNGVAPGEARALTDSAAAVQRARSGSQGRPATPLLVVTDEGGVQACFWDPTWKGV